MAIFTILFLPFHESGIAFHLLRSYLISYFKDINFLSYRTFTYLVRVTPRNFIFVIIVKGAISLISFSDYLFFEYRNVTGLFFLILYLAILLKLLSSLGVLWWNFWGHLSILSSHLKILIFWIFLSNLYPLDLLLLSHCSG